MKKIVLGLVLLASIFAVQADTSQLAVEVGPGPWFSSTPSL